MRVFASSDRPPASSPLVGRLRPEENHPGSRPLISRRTATWSRRRGLQPGLGSVSLCDAERVRENHRLHAIAEAEFAEDPVDVGLDRGR